MAEYQEFLTVLDNDPGNVTALSRLEEASAGIFRSKEAAAAFDQARKSLRERGQLEVVAKLFDVELKATTDLARRADLLLEKGHLYAEDLLNDDSAVECFREVLALRPDDERAQETLAHIDLVRENWRKIVDKYLEEAKVATDRQLTTSLYLSAAETFARYQPNAAQVELYLRKALEVDSSNRRAALHLERLLRALKRWEAVAELLEQRVDAASTQDERLHALLGLADLARKRLDRPELALECMKKVLAAEPAHPRALRVLGEIYEQSEDWSALVLLYANALKAQRRSTGDEELDLLLKVAMLYWQRLDNPDAAEEYFRRIRKANPAHREALDFYRTYYPQRNETSKLFQVLRQAQKELSKGADEEGIGQLSVEIASLAENELSNPEKAIESWKSIFRADPESTEARLTLQRLYRKTEKWNALLDLMKDDAERLPADDIQGRIEKLMEIVAVYRDKLQLDVMVINTYNSILALDPYHAGALDSLIEKYSELGRWNDLITTLTKRAELPGAPAADRVSTLRQIAGLWSERFGNYAQAIKPLEKLLEIDPDDAAAAAQLKEIYTRRKQWRPLIALLEGEASRASPSQQCGHYLQMARIATERLGDLRLSIELWNRILALPGYENDSDALTALQSLYEREKRHIALAEIYRRMCTVAGDDRETSVSLLERLGLLFADRLKATQQAAEVFEEVLTLDPGHGRALRSLRDLYVHGGDAGALEQLYGRLGQWEDLVDCLSSMADRNDDRGAKLELLTRAAQIAQQRFDNSERIARAYERVLAVDPANLEAARALVPIYTETRKWARLLTSYEILLGAAESKKEQLQLHLDIRDLCERQLGSKALAFQWMARAYALDPDDDDLLTELKRLGAEADAWEEVATVLDARCQAGDLEPPRKLALLRDLGRIAMIRLHDPERARRYQERVLEQEPNDAQAIAALEEIATQLSEWPELLKVYQRRADLEKDDGAKVELLFKITFLQEERLGDLEAAAATYEEILRLREDFPRALRGLAKVQEARRDWHGLAETFERQLRHPADSDQKVELMLRLGALYEDNLNRPEAALPLYKEALSHGAQRKQVHRALERFLSREAPAGEANRIEVARLLLPLYEQAGDAGKIAAAIDVLRAAAADPEEQLAYDRRLVRLYGERLGEYQAAYDGGLRILEAAPDDRANRIALQRYAVALEISAQLAAALEAAMAVQEERGSDPMARRELAAELAEMYEAHLEQPERAEQTWLKVLEIDPTAAAAYDALDRIYRGGERWRQLRDLLLCREQNTLHADRRKQILLQICDLEEGVLHNSSGAIGAYQRLLEIDPAMLRPYKALERLYAESEEWGKLEELLGRESDHVPEPDAIELTCQRAILRARKLRDYAGAVDLAEEVVAQRPDHRKARELLEWLLPQEELKLRIARLLAPLYEQERRWRDLCVVLRAQREFATSPEEAVELLSRVATIEMGRMGQEAAAFATWLEAVRTQPAAEAPRRALAQLAAPLNRWPELAAAYEAALAQISPVDLALRGEVLAELADIYDQKLGDRQRSISAYQRLLDLDPGNLDTARDAGAILARLYAEEENWTELIEILRRQADWAETGAERTDLLEQVAAIYQHKLRDAGAAVAAWRDVLTEDPDNAHALDALEGLYADGGHYLNLIEILRRRVERAELPLERKEHLRGIAHIYEELIGDKSEAIAAHLEALDYIPDDRETLAELARLFRASHKYADLYDTLQRQLALSEGGQEALDLSFELGVLLRDHLERGADALDRFAAVLVSDPDYVAAKIAVEAMVEDRDVGLLAADILQPLYERDGEYEKLAALLLRVAQRLESDRERLLCLRRVAQIRERELGDAPGAFDVLAKAARSAVGDPELYELLAGFERLAAQLGREEEIITLYEEIAPDVLDGELQRRLYLEIADRARLIRQDTELARRYYQKALDARPDDRRALGALETIYREQGSYPQLYEILCRRAELAGDDLRELAAVLAESASLCTDHLGRPDEAISIWEQVMEIAPQHSHAAACLEQLYEKGERWHDLVGLIERRLRTGLPVADSTALRFRLGEIYEHQLLNPDVAVDYYRTVLAQQPGHSGAMAALERALDEPGTQLAAAEVLEPVYVTEQDWQKLVRIYEIKLEAADQPTERLELTRYIARLYEEQLEDLDGAFRWYGRVFREAPEDVAIRDQLGRLAAIQKNWTGLANIYQDYLSDEPGDAPHVQEVTRTLAYIFDRRLEDIDRALPAYRRLLVAAPEDGDAFSAAEAMLVRARRWAELVDLYQDAIAGAEDLTWRLQLYLRAAEIYKNRLGDAGRAIDAYRAVLDIDPDHVAAANALETLYKVENQWYELADLLVARVERAPSEREADPFRLRLAEVMEKRLEDVHGATDQYEIVLCSPEGWEPALAALERLILREDCRQRILDILEPVYRVRDWWQKLVVILDARLEFVEDHDTRIALLREIAEIHESRGGDPLLALRALSQAWRVDPSSQDLYRDLSILAARLGAWDELVETLQEGIKEVYDHDQICSVLAQVAAVHETQRGDNRSAIATWRQILQHEEDQPQALEALDRLLTAEGEVEELLPVLARRSEVAEQPEEKIPFLHRIAAIWEQRLSNGGEAIAAYKAILLFDDSDRGALDALERLYRAQEEWSDLIAVISRKIELAVNSEDRRLLYLAAAGVFDGQLNDPYEAINQLLYLTQDNPRDREALARLDDLYQREKMWPELLEVLDRRIACESDGAIRVALSFRGAQVVERELLEPQAAVDRYAAVLEMQPAHGEARAALDQLARQEETLEPASDVLERLFRSEDDFDRVADLYERRLESLALDSEQRRRLYLGLVEVHAVCRQNLDAAFAVWTRALAEWPDDEWVQGNLEQLSAARGNWEALTALYEERLAALADAELEYAYAVKLAKLYEEALGDLERAAEKYRQALDVAADEREALAALDRIYSRSGRFAELAEVLVRQADAAMDEGNQADFLFRLGDLREHFMGDLPGAVAAYRDVLDYEPTHAAARGAFERLLSSNEADCDRGEIVAILEPLYENEGEHGRLADLLAVKLRLTEDHLDRAQIYARLAELAETQLADPLRAMDAAGGWLAEDSHSEQALAELERLAHVVGRWGDVAARLSGIAESVDSDDLRRRLLLRLGAVQLERLGDRAGAEPTLRQVLELDPESQPALVQLERLYRENGRVGELAEVLWRRGELAFDVAEKRRCFAEVAALREELEDLDGAIAAWNEVLASDEGDRKAHRQLAAIYHQRGAWRELVELLALAARYAADRGEERAIKTRIAQVTMNELDEPAEAVEAWHAVLDIAPDAGDALDALERIQTEREDWLAVQDVMVRRLALVQQPGERIAILRQLAALALHRREAPDDAVAYLYRVLDIDPAHFDSYDELEKLLVSQERWHDQIELLERMAAVYADLGRTGEEIACFARAADVWEGPLEDSEAAVEVLEAILRRDETYVPALTRLARLYESAADWERCSEVLQRAVALNPTGREAADLYFRLGAVAEHQSGDKDLALRYCAQALRCDPHHSQAVAAFEAEARQREDWAVVADMLNRRLSFIETAQERLAISLELARLYGDNLGQPDQVVPLLEQARQLAPDDIEILGPLADAYFAVQRYSDAAPLYERLGEEARRNRQMREVAVCQQKLGRIRETLGDIEAALAAYEEAFRVNPTQIETMAGLGRIYMARGAWENARRVYRSMVLQNLDSTAGMTKSDVYYQLGTVHLKLGEAGKARGMFQRALELDPSNDAVRAALEQL